MTSATLAYELRVGPFTGRDLMVASFRGREEISRPFRFDVVVAAGDGSHLADAALLGQAAALIMHVEEGEPRVVRGVVASVERTGRDPVHGEIGFRLRLVPRLWLLRRRLRSRVFQDTTVSAVVEEVVAEYGIACRWRLSRPPQPRAYCVQHQETDLAFVTRVLAEDGIFFCFAPGAIVDAGDLSLDRSTTETLILSDTANYPSLDLALLHRDVEGLRPGAAFASKVVLRRSVRPNVAVVRDFDFLSPSLLPTDQAPAASADVVQGIQPEQLEHYEHHGEYDRPEVADGSARAVLEQVRRRAAVARGASWCRRLLPGHTFTLAEHPLDDLDGAYVLTRVVHEGTNPSRGAGGERPQVYKNRFECVPAGVPYRPRRPLRTLKQVTETALVVGPPGQEIHTDEHGRVKVLFHWDREGTSDEGRSCWIRVAQAWAGPGWGFQFVPRVGMEVLVTFLGGDTDRPVITGCLYNALNPPSHPLPRMATRSGIRTRTVGGTAKAGFNEISFEDALGEEQVFLHAERDLAEVVEHDHRLVVGHRDPASPVGCQSIEVGDSRTLTVGVDQMVSIGGDDQETVHGERIHHVIGGATLRVEGMHEQWDGASFHQHVAHEHRLTVGGALESNVAAKARVTTGGDHEANVGGNHRLSVRGSFTMAAGEVGLVNAGHGLTLTSATSIRLVSGESVVEIGPKEITLSSPTITLLGGKMVAAHVEGAGVVVEKKKVGVAAKEVKLSSAEAEVSLTSDGLVGASRKNVALHGKGSNVILGDEAEVNGAKVKLKSGSKVDGEYDNPQPVEASYIDISLTTPVPKQGDATQVNHQGVAGARFVVEASDGRVFQGVLDAEGKARVPIPKGQAKVSFPDYDAGGIKVK